MTSVCSVIILSESHSLRIVSKTVSVVGCFLPSHEYAVNTAQQYQSPDYSRERCRAVPCRRLSFGLIAIQLWNAWSRNTITGPLACGELLKTALSSLHDQFLPLRRNWAMCVHKLSKAKVWQHKQIPLWNVNLWDKSSSEMQLMHISSSLCCIL